MLSAVLQQQRFYRSANNVMTMRGQLRQGLDAVATDLRGISPAAGDVYALSDRAIELRATTGSSIACRVIGTGTIVLPPVTLTSGNRLTAWSTAPVATDSFFVYDDSTSSATAAWKAYRIQSITTASGASGCTTGSGFVAASDTTRQSFVITIPAADSLPPTMLAGAPVRFFRRVRYELYQAKDQRWYLGFLDCLAGRTPACNTLSPMAGPFRASSTNQAQSGLLFSYFDSTGTAMSASLANAPRITRIGVSLRGEASGLSSLGGGAITTVVDSLVLDVSLRNRR
jgi:hypothetical protein